MRYVVFSLLFFIVGCKSIELQTTKSWEGHFKSVKQFKDATNDIKLDKNETIWVLSDRTLNRVLKNIESN